MAKGFVLLNIDLVNSSQVNQAQTERLPLKPVIQDINQWPLTKTTSEQKEFKAQVRTRTLNALKRNFQDSSEFYELLKNVIYLEKIRLTQKSLEKQINKVKHFLGRYQGSDAGVGKTKQPYLQ